MKQVIKIFTICLAIFCLSSCVFLTENTLNQAINDNNFLNRFPDNQKTIAILKLQGKKNEKVYLCQEKSVIDSNIKDCQPIYTIDQYHILMLNPGSYYFFNEPKNRPIFSNKKTNLNQKYFAILDAKAGKMIYAGDIFYKQIANIDADGETKIINQKFAVNDNFALIQNILEGKNSKQKDKLFSNQTWEVNYLIKNYSSLKNRFEKKLLESKQSDTK